MTNETKPQEKIGHHYAIGTRAKVRVVGGWRVVCATCGAGGTVLHRTSAAAFHAAARDSATACRACGAS